MKKKNVLIGVIIVSAIIAGGLAVIQSQRSAYVVEELYYEEALEIPREKTVDYSEGAPPPMAEEMAAAPSGERAPAVPTEPKVIKTSYMSLEVEEFRKAADAVGDIAKGYGGYVSNSSVRDVGGRKVGYVTVRVPGEKFEDAIKEIEGVGTLKEENVSLEDVTERYIDLKARLENLERQEERYLEILDMAVLVEDVLKVETQLERIRGDIESLQGTLNYLDNRIDLSTIQVQLSEPVEVVHEPGIKDAFNRAIDGFLAAVRGIIVFLGYFIPIAIFLAIVAFGGWFLYRKMSKGR
ncbi:MAG: DUF4349 domain-containing protein [Theionarchaea archaeon]|nr:MAG: hypothetical protein AYK19_12430 [Theionarchaea archaeon DG-70-1]MBU7027838.1 DUF4349 domain-containing protein [Theionarchaea archaeon]